MSDYKYSVNPIKQVLKQEEMTLVAKLMVTKSSLRTLHHRELLSKKQYDAVLDKRTIADQIEYMLRHIAWDAKSFAEFCKIIQKEGDNAFYLRKIQEKVTKLTKQRPNKQQEKTEDIIHVSEYYELYNKDIYPAIFGHNGTNTNRSENKTLSHENKLHDMKKGAEELMDCRNKFQISDRESLMNGFQNHEKKIRKKYTDKISSLKDELRQRNQRIDVLEQKKLELQDKLERKSIEHDNAITEEVNRRVQRAVKGLNITSSDSEDSNQGEAVASYRSETTQPLQRQGTTNNVIRVKAQTVVVNTN